MIGAALQRRIVQPPIFRNVLILEMPPDMSRRATKQNFVDCANFAACWS
jgi:hypothetical protein